MKERTKRTIDIFLDALINGTLAKGDCTMCAVGNICATIDKKNANIWSSLFYTDMYGNQKINNSFLWSDAERTEAREMISKTEFSEKELMDIEYKFETSTIIHCLDYYKHTKEQIRQDQINGLKAVVELLLRWDGEKEPKVVVEDFVSKCEAVPF